MVTALSDKATGARCNNEHRLMSWGRRAVLITCAVINDCHSQKGSWGHSGQSSEMTARINMGQNAKDCEKFVDK